MIDRGQQVFCCHAYIQRGISALSQMNKVYEFGERKHFPGKKMGR